MRYVLIALLALVLFVAVTVAAVGVFGAAMYGLSWCIHTAWFGPVLFLSFWFLFVYGHCLGWVIEWLK
jgi:hypothetical protein